MLFFKHIELIKTFTNISHINNRNIFIKIFISEKEKKKFTFKKCSFRTKKTNQAKKNEKFVDCEKNISVMIFLILISNAFSCRSF